MSNNPYSSTSLGVLFNSSCTFLVPTAGVDGGRNPAPFPFPDGCSCFGSFGPEGFGNNPTIFLRVCLNTKSDCLLIRTPTTSNRFYRFCCQEKSSSGNITSKCIYSLGNDNTRCSNPSELGKTKVKLTKVISVLTADSEDSNSLCDKNTIQYSYFSGGLSSLNGTSLFQCPDISPPYCGEPQAKGYLVILL